MAAGVHLARTVGDNDAGFFLYRQRIRPAQTRSAKIAAIDLTAFDDADDTCGPFRSDFSGQIRAGDPQRMPQCDASYINSGCACRSRHQPMMSGCRSATRLTMGMEKTHAKG